MTIRSKFSFLIRRFAAAVFFLSCLMAAVTAFPAFSRAGMEEYPVVKLQSLDKVTARTMTFEVRVGSTVKFGPLYIRPRVCRKASPVEEPESAAFLQIWELTPEEKAEWVFSGWMFASSPSLSSMDHPVYDVWVLDCLEETPEADEEGDGDTAENEDEAGTEGDENEPESEPEPGSDDDSSSAGEEIEAPPIVRPQTALPEKE